MKKTCLPLIIGLILLPSLASADGMIVTDYLEKVYLPAQKAVISWNGSDETLVLATKVRVEKLANMAWVIPVPSKTKPEVSEGDIDVFYDLADLFSREGIEAPGFGLMGEGPKDSVEVIEVKKVDIYDITILKATNATDLVDWLNRNGYIISENTTPTLREYCEQENFYFIANKINLANKYENLSITDADGVCAEKVAGFIVRRPYRGILDGEIRWAMEEIGECGNSSFEAVKVAIDLEQGIATPLKITFQPTAPFYPLRISSVNEGSTDVDLYLFSQTPVKDKSGILSVSQMTENTQYLKEDYGLGQDYVTYLMYSGDLKDLSMDSWFEPTEYDSSLDPNYVSMWGEVSSVIYYASLIAAYLAVLALIYLVIPLAIIAFVVIGLIVMAKKVIPRLRKK